MPVQQGKDPQVLRATGGLLGVDHVSKVSDDDLILAYDDNFPTDRYVLEGLAARHGCELRLISTDLDAGLSEEALRSALGDEVALASGVRSMSRVAGIGAR